MPTLRKISHYCCAVVSLLIWNTAMSVNAAPNLVPTEPSTEPNYWCTWYSQNYWIGHGTDLKTLKGVKGAAARDEINEHATFNQKDGWAVSYLPRGREDYIFLIDHGWQTKDPNKRIAGGDTAFNLVMDEEDFPRYAKLEPKERLKQFNADIKKLGWNSLGIWMRGNVTEEQARTFVQWSKYAGIHYWKIDGGDTSAFYCFKAKQEIFPELVLEYVTGAGGNINPKWNQKQPSYPSVYEIGGSLQKPMLNCLKNSDVFRTYDSSPLLMTSTTLRRVHDILKQSQQQPQYRSILNVQDDCNTAIGLGVLVASKRHPNFNERTYKGRDLHHQLAGPRAMQKRIDEAQRFGRWSRLAPAFPAGEGSYLASENELIDRCQFTEYDTWAQNTYGKMVSQSAPAIMARNMPLAIVEIDGPAPFVCTTTYPNGATGIATEGRVSPENKWFEPRAKVTVKIKDAKQIIGIAGHYQELVLDFAGSLSGVKHVWAQDLLATEAKDIMSEVRIEGSRLILPGKLIDQIGTSAATPGDISAPGLVLRLEGENLPIAGEDFTPKTKPITSVKNISPKPSQQADGYRGTATLTKVGDSYKVTANGANQYALKALQKTLTTGKVTFTWDMTPAEQEKSKNGFLIVASDDQATSAIVAGSWMGSNKIVLFENQADWTAAPTVPCEVKGTVTCSLNVDLDARTAALTVNGKTTKISYTESFTSISHVGFGVHRTTTTFSVPNVTK
ncbi:hypothetical protein NT6N_19240 [Oceaniferula spumae]|uniref:Uncharacterized protein n=1 Tax=Oceaniferula spumae TaxID=2979115 RepID=A0AAT9FLP1_9BACT